MLDVLIGVLLGYFIGRFVSILVKPEHDLLLVWTPEVFAWRPCSQAKIDKNKKYLAATRVYPQQQTEELRR